MNKTLVQVLTVGSFALLLYAVAAIVATFTQLANAADRIYLGMGQPVFWALFALFAALVIFPLVLLLRLPKAMQPPATESKEEHAAYETWIQKHLAAHPQVEVSALAAKGDLPGALLVLGAAADGLIRNTAKNVFVSTALIQNGRLDGLLMLATQLRLVWQIGSLYNIRPSPRQLWYLYSNVAGTVLVTSNLEDLDFAEIAGPIVNSVVPSMAASIPGFQGIGNLLVNSIANGSANAFLTLRVGLIAKGYCAPLERPDRVAVRRSATLAALSMLSDITHEKGLAIAKAIWSGTTAFVGKAAGSAVEGTKRAVTATGALFTGTATATADAIEGARRTVGNATATAGEMVVDAAKSVVAKTGSVTDSVGTFSRDAAKSVAGSIVTIGNKTSDAVSNSARAVAEGGHLVGRSTANGLANAAAKVSGTTEDVFNSTAGLFAKREKMVATERAVPLVAEIDPKLTS